jgi:hypothetical protein
LLENTWISTNVSANGPEFVARAVQEWIAAVGAKTAYIERGSPWENGYIESFNARLRDELLNGEVFYTLREAQIIIESWRRHYNTIRPHASIGYKPPAPRCSCLHSPRGRLRCADRLRRPRWRNGHQAISPDSSGRDQQLDQHRFRPLGKLVVGNLDRIADVDDVGD